MVMGDMPRVLSPGETLTLPAAVFATEPDMGDVDVVVESNNQVEVRGSNKKRVSFDKPGAISWCLSN